MPESDEELMARVSEDDQEAFDALYRRYEARLRSLFVSFQCSQDDARDCTQDTFVRLWLARADYRPSGTFAAYLFTIARNCWINRLRKLKCRPVESAMPYEDDPPLPEPEERVEWAPEASLMLDYRRYRVREAVRSIPEPYRQTLELVHLDGMKYVEAAEKLNVPIGTIKSRISNAVKLLRKRLEEEAL